jgi:amino acid adenylation domain-containing protein
MASDRDEVLGTVRALLAEILRRDTPPAPTDTTGALGLGSMAAARLWLELQDRYAVEIPFSTLSGGHTVADLADLVTTGPARPVSPPSKPGERYAPFPLTSIQQSYRTGQVPDLTDDPVGCHQYTEFTVPSARVDRLVATWWQLVARHDMLRMELTPDGRQRILPEPRVRDIPVHSSPEGVRARLAHRTSGPLWTVEMSRQGDDVTVHLDVDGLVADGHGLALLLQQWHQLYVGAELAPAPELTARDCVERMTRASREGDLRYWLDILDGAPGGPDLGRTVGGGPRVPLTGGLDAVTWQAVRERAHAIGVSPSSLVLTVFADALGQPGAFSVVVTTSARTLLPAVAAEVVGPFTSSAVIVVDGDARAVHERVWAAVEHGSVSSVDVLRAARGRAVPDRLPVVFTSMLDLGPMDAGFGADVGYTVSETADIQLDCQIWAHGDSLRVRWDVVRSPVAQVAFARFLNGLRALALTSATTRPLGALQQAYFVARVAQPSDGCQITKTVRLPEADPTEVGAAIVKLIATHPALRSWLDQDGTLRTSDVVPADWTVPIDSTPLAELAGRAFPLGRWPHFDVRLSADSGPPTLYCTFDIAVFDAPSIHFLCRELARLCVDPDAQPRPDTSARTLPIDADTARKYWQDRILALPDPPPVETSGSAGRIRLAASVPGWRDLVRYAHEHDVTPDALLLAAFTSAVADEFETDAFAATVVRWVSDRALVGEDTRLSWVAPEPESLLDAARRITALLRADEAMDAADGLSPLRTRVLRAGGRGYSVVYSSVVDLTPWPLPEDAEDGEWLSCTPGVSLDCVGTADGDVLHHCWDAVAEDFPPGWLAAAFARYGRLVAGITGSAVPEPVGGLTRAEYRTIVYGWNSTSRDFPRDRLVHQLFEDRVREDPAALAVRSRSGDVSRGELDAHANRIARRLVDLGVGRGTVVAVSVRRGPAMVAAVFGVLKAGGTYLPIEPGLPDARAATLLTTTGATTVLSTSDTTRWPAPAGIRVLDVDGLTGDASGVPCPARSSDIAYVIFTSGSTGAPKGVAVAHRAVSNLIAWCARTYGFGPGDLGLAVASLGFDLSVFDLFGVLGRGGALYVTDEKDPALLLDILLTEPVTFWNSAPAALAQLAPLLSTVDCPNKTLRLVFLSGDHTPLALPDQVRAVFQAARLVSLGGATEATVWSNHFPIEAVDPAWRGIPYGTPIDNARYHVLDPRLLPCPVGVEGDLHIAGDCLADGYFNDPALTADRFVPDPFALRPGERMYRTGDRASYQPDGTLIFHGRVDGQVKIRGFRVELGEIEHRLRQHPAIQEAVVLARTDDSGDRKLVAYLMGATLSVRDVRAHAATHLPDYMVPNHVVFLDRFPVTPNGKLDRAALPWPPRGDLRAEVAGLFSDLLGQPVDPDQDIWDQGATSFTLVQVSTELQRRHGHRIPIAAVLADPTVAGIARHLATLLTPQPAQVDFFAAEDRAAFKAEHRNIRPPAPAATRVPLPTGNPTDAPYLRRATRREFQPGPLEAVALGQLLSLLRGHDVAGRVRYLYPSAGDTYAVQAYVHVKPGGVSGVDPGVYYYRAAEHQLERVGDGTSINRSVHFYYNRPLYDEAAFELYLLGQTAAIEPVYQENSPRYLAIEAGHIAQVLMEAQADVGVGLCPVGALSFDRISAQFGQGHEFLLSMLGGPVPTEDVVVVGLSGRMPGADDVDQFWRNLATGVRSIGPAPAGRAELTMPGGYLNRVDEFDSLLFHIAPVEARTLDPQLRLLLQAVWTCLEHAGHTAGDLGRVGVFVAAMWHDYELVGADAARAGASPQGSATASDMPNRISHFFGFTGPSVAVDTSCSSALTALHLAVRALRDDECDAAIVAAANLVTHPYHLDLLRGWGLVAEQPAAGAFDPRATGWSPGEGVGALLLRRSSAASRDGDTKHAVVAATHTGHTGHSGRFGVPDVDELTTSITTTLAGITDVDYVECAVSGALVADTAEIEALAKVFAHRAEPVPIGTVKHTIGHLEAAAGMSQLIKVVQQLRHGQLAPTPLVSVPDLPVRVVTAVEPLPESRTVLVNAVGAAGSLAHAVLRGAPPQPSTVDEKPQAVPLSAATTDQLRTLAAELRDRLDDTMSITDIAFTLQVGRSHLAHRAGFWVADVPSLREALDAYLKGRTTEAPMLADWLAGADVDWHVNWPAPARRIPLPGYPFATEPLWLTSTSAPANVLGDLRTRYAEVSGIPESRIDPNTPLEYYGLNSALVVQLNSVLERDYGEKSRTLFYECRTLAEVAARLPAPEPAPSGDIAVVGIAGRFPGAGSVDDFWTVLAEGRDCVTPLPADRARPGWPTDLMWGGYLTAVDEFDALLFGIAPRDADLMDPQERLLLEVVWETLEDAGYPRSRLPGEVGVFAATMYSEYPFFGVEASLSGPAVSTGSSVADLANRVSYAFDLSGPSLTVDTMCSSSLTALHLAATSLRLGECSAAIVGGVNLSLHPNKFVEQDQLRMRSTDHRCRAFGAGGDGFTPGEGVVAVLLKPLATALADGDRIHAVVKGTAVNHGGRTSGYTVPNPTAHSAVISAAWADAGVPVSTVGYVEAHGTGTALGDPIEIAGLDAVFGLPPGSCPLGSVKSNIGHLEGAAGLAGLAKVVLQMRHTTLVPTLHADEPNPDINWAHTPFHLQRTRTPWPRREGTPLRAGISSFGAGGSNAHVVVEEYVPPPRPPAAPAPRVIVLSARDSTRLRLVASRLAEHLRAEQPDLDDLAFTLQVGRQPLRERLAFTADNLEDVRSVLGRFLAGDVTGVARGRVDGPPPADSGFQGRTPRIVSLPSYPFDRQRHWLQSSPVPLYARTWEPVVSSVGSAGSLPSLLCVHGPETEEYARRFNARLHRVGSDAPIPDVTVCVDLCDLGGDDQWEARLSLLTTLVARRKPVRFVHVVSGLNGLPGPEPSLAGARLAGFVRALAAEYPQLRATVVDVEPDAVVPAVLAECAATDIYLETCWRGGQRHRADLTRLSVAEAEPHLDPTKTYLVTGGTGGIGRLVARHLVTRGARTIALLGLRPVSPDSVRVLEAAGARVLIHSGSLTDRDALAAFVAQAGPIGGVVHCAGRIGPVGSFTGKDPAAVRAVLDPKVDGTLVLDEVCGDQPDFFVSFSSMAALVPGLAVGVVEYAAANAFLSYHANYRRRGAHAIAWPSWAGVGAHEIRTNAGPAELSTRDGLQVLDTVLAGDLPADLVVSPGMDPRTLFAPRRTSEPGPGTSVPDWLTRVFAETMRVRLDDLDPRLPFGEYGVDSLAIADLVVRLEQHLGRPVEPTTLLDHPTLEQLAAHLGEPLTETDRTKVAVIGMSCRFPGAPDTDAFWQLLREGRCTVGDVPTARWDADTLYREGRSTSRWGGYVTGIEDFDPEYFGLDDEQATCLDPAIRLALEGAVTCLRDAGYQDTEVAGRQVGVFMGARLSNYRDRVGIRAGASAFGGDQNFVAAMLAQHLDLVGPNLVVDTACSSALVAVQLAMRSLVAGETELAFAGGVDVLLDERVHLEFSAAKALSPTGRCRTFDAAADGFVPGEGCGVFLLKRLDRALADGDRIRAVIDAVAVGNDGRTMGLTTPNPTAQADVVRRALNDSGHSAADVSMVEAHGTATRIGDPIELRALTTVFAETTDKTGFCGIGSVKSNVGHLLSAAGAAGLAKVVLALEHGEIPPTLFCPNPNPRFDFAASPFRPVTELQRRPDLRVAGLSAFGVGGTNAHLIASAANQARTVREPLPAPEFRRRRRWLDRDAPPVEELVTSLLSFDLTPVEHP